MELLVVLPPITWMLLAVALFRSTRRLGVTTGPIIAIALAGLAAHLAFSNADEYFSLLKAASCPDTHAMGILPFASVLVVPALFAILLGTAATGFARWQLGKNLEGSLAIGLFTSVALFLVLGLIQFNHGPSHTSNGQRCLLSSVSPDSADGMA